MLMLVLFSVGWGLAITCAIKWWHTAQDLHWEQERHRMTKEEVIEARRQSRWSKNQMVPFERDAEMPARDADAVAGDMPRTAE